MSGRRGRPRIIKFSVLKRLSYCNSPRLPKAVNMLGKRMEWVGVGWIYVGPATGREVKVVEG